jgi:hypothetical protein
MKKTLKTVLDFLPIVIIVIALVKGLFSTDPVIRAVEMNFALLYASLLSIEARLSSKD